MLLGPEIFLMHHATSPFVIMLRRPHTFPVKAVQEFHRWATSVGFNPVWTHFCMFNGEWCAGLRKRTPESSKWHHQ